jgi:hypothetical protein
VPTASPADGQRDRDGAGLSIAPIAAVALLVVVPGLGAVLLVFPPGRISFASALALMFGFGYSVTALTAAVLAVSGVLGSVSFLAAVAGVTILVWAGALFRHGLRSRLVEIREGARNHIWANSVGIGVIALFAAVRFHRYSPLLNYDIAAGWRYWADGLIIAHAGHIPAHTPGWGSTYPTTVSKVILNSYLAALSYHLAPLAGMAGVLWVSAVGMFTGLWALARELGLRIVAPLVPILVVALPAHVPLNQEITSDLDVFTAEDLGRMVSVAALVIGIRAVRQRDPASAFSAGIVLLVAEGTHLIPAVVAAGLLGVYAVTYAVSVHAVRRTLLTLGIVAATALIGWAAIVTAAGGQLGFERVSHASGTPGYPAAYDPARSFQLGKPIFVPGRARRPYYFLPRTIVDTYLTSAVGSNARRPPASAVAIFAVTAAISILLLVFRRFELAPVGAMALALAISIVLVALAFDYRYSTLVPADFGLHRLYDYDAIPLVLAAAGGAEVVGRLLASWNRRGELVLAAVAVVLTVGALLDLHPSRAATTAPAAKRLFASVRAVVPCDSRILPDARTAGSFAALTGRESVVEGMAPYLNPAVMHQVLPILFAARQFFAHPSENAAFLRREHVDFVLLLTDPTVRIGQSGGRLGRHVDRAGLRSLPELHRVLRRNTFQLYAVGRNVLTPPGDDPKPCATAIA